MSSHSMLWCVGVLSQDKAEEVDVLALRVAKAQATYDALTAGAAHCALAVGTAA